MEAGKVKKLIKLNKIQEAITVLEEVVPDDNRLISIASDYKRVVHAEMNDIITFAQLSSEKDRVVNNLLSLVDDVSTNTRIITDAQRNEMLNSLMERYENRKKQKLNPRPRFNLTASIEYASQGVSEKIKTNVYLIKENRQTNFDKLFDAFYKNLKRIVIIGPYGSGKTFLAIDFALKLIHIAYANEDFPIPIILDTSSWGPDEDFKDWLKRILPFSGGNSRISEKYTEELIQSHKLLPILDDFSSLSEENLETKIASLEKYINESRGKRDIGKTYPELIVTTQDKRSYYQNLEVYAAIRIKRFINNDISEVLKPFVEENDTAAKRLVGYLGIRNNESSVQTIFHLKLILILLESSRGDDLFNINGFESIDIALDEYVEGEMKNLEFSSRYKKAQKYFSWLSKFVTEKNGNNPTFELLSFQPKNLEKKDLWKFRAIYGLLTGFSFTFIFLVISLIIDLIIPGKERWISNTVEFCISILVFSLLSSVFVGIIFGIKEDIDKEYNTRTIKQKILRGIRNATIALLLIIIIEFIYDFPFKHIIENYIIIPIVVFLITLGYDSVWEQIFNKRTNFYAIEIDEINEWTPTFNISIGRLFKNIGNILGAGFFLGNVFGFILYAVNITGAKNKDVQDQYMIWLGGQMFGFLGGLFIGTLVGLIKSQFSPKSVPIITNAYARFFFAVRFNFIIFFIAFIFFIILIFIFLGDSVDLKTMTVFVFAVGVPISFLYSFSAFFKHIALRIVLFVKGVLPLKLVAFLNDTLRYTGILEKDGGRWRFQHQLIQEKFYDAPQ